LLDRAEMMACTAGTSGRMDKGTSSVENDEPGTGWPQRNGAPMGSWWSDEYSEAGSHHSLLSIHRPSLSPAGHAERWRSDQLDHRRSAGLGAGGSTRHPNDLGAR